MAKPDQFFNEGYEFSIRNMVDHVIDTEGPIHEDILARRIARHHGFKKAGSRIRERVLGIASGPAEGPLSNRQVGFIGRKIQ